MVDHTSWPQTGQLLANGSVTQHVVNVWVELHIDDGISEINVTSRGDRHSRALRQLNCRRQAQYVQNATQH